MFIAVLSLIVEKLKQTKCPSIDKWKKENMIYLYNGILFSQKKKLSTNIDTTTWTTLKTLPK